MLFFGVWAACPAAGFDVWPANGITATLPTKHNSLLLETLKPDINFSSVGGHSVLFVERLEQLDLSNQGCDEVHNQPDLRIYRKRHLRQLNLELR